MVRGGEDQLPARLEHPIKFRECSVSIEQMRQGFAEPHHVEARILEGHRLLGRGRGELGRRVVASRTPNRVDGDIGAHDTSQPTKQVDE